MELLLLVNDYCFLRLDCLDRAGESYVANSGIVLSRLPSPVSLALSLSPSSSLLLSLSLSLSTYELCETEKRAQSYFMMYMARIRPFLSFFICLSTYHISLVIHSSSTFSIG